MIVGKAVRMAGLMNIPILGIIENMSYIACPDCGKKLYPFGESKAEALAAEYKLPLLAQLPIESKLAALCDAGTLETFEGDWLEGALDVIEKL